MTCYLLMSLVLGEVKDTVRCSDDSQVVVYCATANVNSIEMYRHLIRSFRDTEVGFDLTLRF